MGACRRPRVGSIMAEDTSSAQSGKASNPRALSAYHLDGLRDERGEIVRIVYSYKSHVNA